MTSLRQIAANQRNSEKSTGPRTEEGKRRSRRNALRHGLCAETVIDVLEDVEDYKAFELAITTHYDAQSAVERELVLRLASLLWRVRRATSIETALWGMEAERLGYPLTSAALRDGSLERPPAAQIDSHQNDRDGTADIAEDGDILAPSSGAAAHDLARCFLQLATRDNGLFDRLGRYEAALWRQVVQTLAALRWAQRPLAPAREAQWWRKR